MMMVDNDILTAVSDSVYRSVFSNTKNSETDLISFLR